MCHVSHVTCHMSRVTCNVSRVTCHMSHVMCHMSGVTCHVSHVIIFFFFRTIWWSLSVEGLLSTGPTPSSFITLRWRWHIYLKLWLIIFQDVIKTSFCKEDEKSLNIHLIFKYSHVFSWSLGQHDAPLSLRGYIVPPIVVVLYPNIIFW